MYSCLTFARFTSPMWQTCLFNFSFYFFPSLRRFFYFFVKRCWRRRTRSFWESRWLCHFCTRSSTSLPSKTTSPFGRIRNGQSFGQSRSVSGLSVSMDFKLSLSCLCKARFFSGVLVGGFCGWFLSRCTCRCVPFVGSVCSWTHLGYIIIYRSLSTDHLQIIPTWWSRSLKADRYYIPDLAWSSSCCRVEPVPINIIYCSICLLGFDLYYTQIYPAQPASHDGRRGTVDDLQQIDRYIMIYLICQSEVWHRRNQKSQHVLQTYSR